MRVDDYEVSYKNGYYTYSTYKTSEEGKEYKTPVKTYATKEGLELALGKFSCDIGTITLACNKVYQEYVQEVSQTFIKAKEKALEKKA